MDTRTFLPKQTMGNSLPPGFGKAILIILSIGIFVVGLGVFSIWRLASTTHDKLQKNGVVTTARVVKIDFTKNLGRVGEGPTDDPLQASSIRVHVEYQANNITYSQNVNSTFGTKDHWSVYQDAIKGSLLVRYLKGDPTVVRPEAEFADPDNNPYFGGK